MTTNTPPGLDDKMWPPGTMRIELLMPSSRETEIILQPKPSEDPNDPLNWKIWEKYWNFFLVNYYTFMTYLYICAATATWQPMHNELGFSYTLLNNSYAIGCGTLGIGAFLLIPFALKYGRRPVYIISMAVQVGMSVWSARLHNTADLMLTNALSCLAAALSEAIVQMTVADMFFVHQRGRMNSLFIWSIYFGAATGPLAAGYISDAQGWRWFWWYNAIFFGVGFVFFVFTYEETKYNHRHSPADTVSNDSSPSNMVKVDTHELCERDTKNLASHAITSITLESGPSLSNVDPTGNLTSIQLNPNISRKTYWQRFTFVTNTPGQIHSFIRHSYQPLIMAFTIPGIGYMALVYAIVLAFSVVTIVTYSSVMLGPPWNFGPSAIGLMILPTFVGSSLGCMLCGPMSDWIILWLAKRNGGIFEPEMRLWTMIPFAVTLPLGSMLFGYGLEEGWSWPSIAINLAISNFGGGALSAISVTYVTDAYTEIVGDALVGSTFARNLLSTTFVFALQPWIDAVGLTNVYLTIGIVSIFVLSFVGVFIWRGKAMRVWTTKRYRWYAERQFGARRI